MKNQTGIGETLTRIAPTGGVISGQGYKIGQLFVVALETKAQTLPFACKIHGEYTLPKLSAQAWTVGALVYWDNTNFWATTVGTANLLIGSAAAIAANPTATGQILLSGIPRADGA